jgi:hypothetical protein
MTFLSKVNGKNENRSPYQGVVKRDWVPTGRIDFATHLDGNAEDADQPNDFKLLVEERRIVDRLLLRQDQFLDRLRTKVESSRSRLRTPASRV